MQAQAIPADEQLAVTYEPGAWRLYGPDGSPVLEARPRSLFYHPLFGRWRDLPPGDRMSVDAVMAVEMRWERGWVVGLTLNPSGMWRPLVRWQSPRQAAQAEEIARALSQILSRPLRLEDTDLRTPVTRVRRSSDVRDSFPAPGESHGFEQYGMRAAEAAVPAEPLPVLRPAPERAVPREAVAVTARASMAAAEALMANSPPVYLVDDVSDVRLPLRLGGGSSVQRDERSRLVLLLNREAPESSLGLTMLGGSILVVLLTVVVVLGSGVLGQGTLPQIAAISAGLITIGVIGLLLLPRLNRQTERRIIFDRMGGEVTFLARGKGKPLRLPLSAVHGVRISGRAIHQQDGLAYERTVTLILDRSEDPLFTEVRLTELPTDSAMMPSLATVRRQADDLAGPSMARAAARVVAWYLGIPLADEQA